MNISQRPWVFSLVATLCFTLVRLNECVTRIYYIGIKEESWNYAPSGKNIIKGLSIDEDKQASVFLQQGPHRIGSVYKKAVYWEYRDGSYTEEIPKPEWLGFLGPVLKAEVEDVIVVHLKNFASRPYSLHPHGVFYEKDSEGALYPDGTSGKQKKDDSVPPGGSHTYTWIVKQQFAPTEDDPNCLTWAYHSHRDEPKDMASGLIGALLTCKKGVLQGQSRDRTDVDKDFILMFSVVDENLSWYLDENIEAHCTNPYTVDRDEEEFQESNKMHAINGFLFGNLPGLEMCANKKVSWHMFGMGNEVDIHSAYFHGHTVLDRGHRSDVISLFPATFVTSEMITENVGKWMLSCQVNDHIQAGMQALYQVSECNAGVHKTPSTGKERKYYIAAESVLWNYGPLGYSTYDGLALNLTGSKSETFFGKSGGRIGGEYMKVVYVEYTDKTFATKKERTRNEKHLGILGPVIKAEVGDTILVTFMNKGDKNLSIQPHGVQYSKGSEGTNYIDGFEKPGSHVQPNESFTYRWTVTEGPSQSDPDCLSYLYYSAVDPVQDTNSGLVGPLLVCRKDALNEKGLQRGVDKEFYLLFTVFDENLSWYLESNIERFVAEPSSIDQMDEDFQESNKMHAINGYMFGNMPGLDMCKGDNVSWHLMGLGNEVDIHGVYFQGNTIQRGGMTRDTLSLFPHTSVTAAMQPDTAGKFEISCRTSDHYLGGMKGFYSVQDCGNRTVPHQLFGSLRTYYIAAEELEWDYSPDRSWELQLHNASMEESYGHTFVGKGEDLIGSKYRKVAYREYTNSQFTELKKRSPQEEHLEILGPIIRAEVGDAVLVVFKNKASRPYSVHAHGVERVDLENTLEVPNTEPGDVKMYRWNVPERSGPGRSDPNCLTWVYYSSADIVKDMYSGLIGPLITCRKGFLNEKGLRRDVDREFALLFMVFDENESWYLDESIQTYLHKDPEEVEKDEHFLESNKIHAINGKIYGNLHGLTMTQNEKTDWYLLGMGNEIDIHMVHFHAQSFIFKTDKAHRADVYDLFPGTFQTVELIAENPGTWLLHCHVADHIHAGMATTFTVVSQSGTQISCFSPSSFSWRQAAFVDSFCWAAVQKHHLLQNDSERVPLWLHKFFPYILLLVAILMYIPSLFWRFTAAPHLYSDLAFIMEELDRSYNRSIKLAKSFTSNGKLDSAAGDTRTSLWDLTEGCFRYPLVEQYLKTKKSTKNLIIKYLICRIVTFIILLFACIYLGYYINLASITDEFKCSIRTGILKNQTDIPQFFQCKLIAVGVFQLLSYVNLIVYTLLAPVVIYTILVPIRQSSDFLKAYQILPAFGVLEFSSRFYDDLSLYLLFLEENLSELKSYKCLKVLEHLQVNGEEGFDAMCLLRNLGQVKTDTVDGKLLQHNKTEVEPRNSATELKDLSNESLEDGVKKDRKEKEDQKVRQRLLESTSTC